MAKSVQEKEQLLEEVARQIREECECPLKKTALNAVPGAGNPDADVLCVGEAPGKYEDEQGLPFVGSAGKVLEQLLDSIGLTRADVFITSIEKFHPPHNREPTWDEIAACFPYLIKQIEIIDPKVIVTLGGEALDAIREWDKGLDLHLPIFLEKLHGKMMVSPETGYTYLFTYHPAAVLYNRSLMPKVKKDFKKIVEVVGSR